MELHGANVVKVTQQGKEAPPELVVPHFDLVVITAGNNEWLNFVKVDSSHRPIMLVESL